MSIEKLKPLAMVGGVRSMFGARELGMLQRLEDKPNGGFFGVHDVFRAATRQLLLPEIRLTRSPFDAGSRTPDRCPLPIPGPWGL